jgi:hypothetical protein
VPLLLYIKGKPDVGQKKPPRNLLYTLYYLHRCLQVTKRRLQTPTLSIRRASHPASLLTLLPPPLAVAPPQGGIVVSVLAVGTIL